MPEREPHRQEVVEGGTFTIRGHHLELFKHHVQPDFLVHSPPTSRFFTDIAANNMRSRFENFADYGYRIDVIGETKSSAEAYETRISKIFKRFHGLSDNDRVEIVSTSDEICRACYRGEHCKEFGVKDDNYILDFAVRARELGLGDNINLIEEEVVLSNALSVMSYKLTTTAETVRRVLEHPVISGFW